MYDVTIVGGGPAGAIAAHRAAKAGLSVLVLEKAKYPRDKPCGWSSVNCSVRGSFFRITGILRRFWMIVSR